MVVRTAPDARVIPISEANVVVLDRRFNGIIVLDTETEARPEYYLSGGTGRTGHYAWR